MLIFRYDKTFEGLLTAIFDAYSIKRFPDILLAAEETPPLFYDEIITVVTDEERSNRVWKGLQKKTIRLGPYQSYNLLVIRTPGDRPRTIQLHSQSHRRTPFHRTQFRGSQRAGTLKSLEKSKQ